MVDRVVVTGAAGTIGRAVVDLLVRRSIDVVALIRPDEQLDSLATVLAGDCRDESFVAAAMRDADAVIHLAAIPSPGAHPAAELFENNTVSTFVVLDQAGLAGVDRALVASSLSALGFPWSPTATSPQYTPVDTRHPLVPTDPYGLSKVVDECTAEMMHRRHGINALLYRFPQVTSQPELEQLATAWAVNPAAGARTLWSYLETRDAVAALAAGLECSLAGVHRLMLAAPTTVMSETTTSLMARFHPSTQIRSPLHGRNTPIDAEPANQMLGIRPAHVHPFTGTDP